MTHLIYLHQGHAALPSYLINLASIMEPLLDGESCIAWANPYPISTMYGIKDSVDNVVQEIDELLHLRPEVKVLSFVGVSLGGVILERALERLVSRLENVELRYLITFASPLNGITVGWNMPTVIAKLLGWLDPTLTDLIAMHEKQRETVEGISRFRKRICLGNLKGDWKVPLTSALPVGGNWPWSTETRTLVQTACDGSCVQWHAIVLDLSDCDRDVHHAIVDDKRSIEAIRQVIGIF